MIFLYARVSISDTNTSYTVHRLVLAEPGVVTEDLAAHHVGGSYRKVSGLHGDSSCCILQHKQPTSKGTPHENEVGSEHDVASGGLRHLVSTVHHSLPGSRRPFRFQLTIFQIRVWALYAAW